MTRARALFFGTPAFAVPCLDALADICDVVLCITQPDRPSGRGLSLSPPPVKVRAQERGIPVLQPLKVRTPEFAEELRAQKADLALVVAYGRILPVGVLSAPRLGCFNVHASLLPKWRGAAPIQWSVVNGDKETGVCLMQMDEGLDTGPVIARASLSIGPDETSGELTERLSELGAELVRTELPHVLANDPPRIPQDHAASTHAPILQKAHGRIDFTKNPQEVHDLVRGMSPWPAAQTLLGTTHVKVHRTHIVKSESLRGTPGEVLRADKHEGIVVACGDGAIAFDELQPEGKRRMTASELLAGRFVSVGDRFATKGSDA